MVFHLYITDIMPEQLSPEDVALLYRAGSLER